MERVVNMSTELTTTDSQRFLTKVTQELNSTLGSTSITDYQKRLIQNYFITIDAVLKKNESKRFPQNESLEYSWKNVNMNELAKTSRYAAILGLDSLAKNNLSFVTFKNKALNKYDINFWTGYVGKELIATKYAIDMPVVTCELIYSNDKFKAIKKDIRNPVENYEWEQGDPFEQGREVVGGFYYYDYTKKHKNKIITMTLKDILKRKPDKASVEFWGGEKDVWKNGKKTGEKETCEGWFEEMCLKTVKNKAYDSITIDPSKMDDTYQFLRQQEVTISDIEVENEIDENANSEEIPMIKPEIVTYKVLANKINSGQLVTTEHLEMQTKDKKIETELERAAKELENKNEELKKDPF